MSVEVKEVRVLRASEQGGEESCMGREPSRFVELPLKTPDKKSGMPALREIPKTVGELENCLQNSHWTQE